MRVILASSSKQRKDIFDMIGLKYEIITSDVEEKSSEIMPNKYVEELSLNKALSVSKQIKDKAIIIAADTVVYFNGKIYEKPKSKQEAFNNLKELSGNKNTVWTGITIIDLYKNKTINLSEKTDIYFNNILDDEIEWYVNNESKIYKCCGYVPLGKGSMFIKKIDGDFNNFFGISPSIIFSKLKELGYSIDDFEFNNNL